MLTSTKCHFKGGQNLITVRLWYYAKLRDSRTHCRTTTRGGGVLWISSDRDDQRTFLALKFSILGFCLSRKILASIFWGSLI